MLYPAELQALNEREVGVGDRLSSVNPFRMGQRSRIHPPESKREVTVGYRKTLHVASKHHDSRVEG